MKLFSLLIGQFDYISERKLFAGLIGRQNENRMIAITRPVGGELQIPTDAAVGRVHERRAAHHVLRVAVLHVTRCPLESGLVHRVAGLATIVSSWGCHRECARSNLVSLASDLDNFSMFNITLLSVQHTQPLSVKYYFIKQLRTIKIQFFLKLSDLKCFYEPKTSVKDVVVVRIDENWNKRSKFIFTN